MRQGKKRYLWLLMALLLLFGLDRRLQVETYSLRSAKIHTPIRLALITDLHSCTYGREQRQLLDAIEAGEPDLILLGGDILDDRRSPELVFVDLLPQ